MENFNQQSKLCNKTKNETSNTKLKQQSIFNYILISVINNHTDLALIGSTG